MISLYSTVVVTEIRHPPTFYDPFKINKSLPQVGDQGAIVDVLRVAGEPNRYVVECVNTSGDTVWLSDFSEDELALAPRSV